MRMGGHTVKCLTGAQHNISTPCLRDVDSPLHYVLRGEPIFLTQGDVGLDRSTKISFKVKDQGHIGLCLLLYDLKNQLGCIGVFNCIKIFQVVFKL